MPLDFPHAELYPSGDLFPSAARGTRPLTPLGEALRDSLPAVLRESTDYLAVLHACAREIERLEATLEQVRAQFDPTSADVLLPAYESMLKLPVGGQGASLDERRALVLGRLRRLLSGGAGRDWERAITAIVGLGWTYGEHDPGNPTSPPAGVIKIQAPIDPASPTFAHLQALLADMTDAHIVVELDTYGAFLLDDSELDVTQFGA